MMRYVQLLSKARGTTVFLMHCFAQGQVQPPVSSLADNIVHMRYGELKGQRTRTISIVKERSSNHDKGHRAFEITDKGMILQK